MTNANDFPRMWRVRFSPLMALGLLTAFAAAAVGARLWLEAGIPWRCPSITLFGIPCPSCGSTRALAALANFDFFTALKFNPFVVLGLLGLPLLTTSNHLAAGWRKHGWTALGVAMGLNWIYLMLFLPRQ